VGGRSVTVVTPEAGINPSTAIVSTAAVTGLAALFTRARLGLTLATGRFVAFPRATLVSLRARAVAAFLFWTFDGCFLRLAMIDPRLVLRKALMTNIKRQPG
jgi:hypothetical protein